MTGKGDPFPFCPPGAGGIQARHSVDTGLINPDIAASRSPPRGRTSTTTAIRTSMLRTISGATICIAMTRVTSPTSQRRSAVKIAPRGCRFPGAMRTATGAWICMSALSGIDFADDGRAICLTDWDHDGDVDSWVSNRSAPQLRLMRNESTGDNHFLGIRLRGVQCNRDAIGARVTVYPMGSGKPLSKTLRAGDGYLAQ